VRITMDLRFLVKSTASQGTGRLTDQPRSKIAYFSGLNTELARVPRHARIVPDLPVQPAQRWVMVDAHPPGELLACWLITPAAQSSAALIYTTFRR
jgi:hypothetical protein